MLNDRNLLSLANNTSTRTCLAHIRAGTGLTPTVGTNNHPFTFGRFTFMHNGVVDKHFEITLDLLALLSINARMNVKGTTDSEQVAALFVTHLDRDGPWLKDYTIEEMEDAMRKTIKDLQRLIEQVGGDGNSGHSALNFCVTDGTQIVSIFSIDFFHSEKLTQENFLLSFLIGNNSIFSSSNSRTSFTLLFY